MVNVFQFFKNIILSRKILCNLAKNDLKERYSGSVLGLAWAIVQPLFTICIMWFVFSFGFRSVPIDDIPFILWLSAGMIPWFFMSEAFIATANCVVEKSYLVKKVVFNITLLPIVKIVSLLFIHIFFIALLILMFGIYGYYPNAMYLQLAYYVVAAACFILALSYITSSIVVFSKDFGQLIGIVVQFLFWATPIFWNLTLIPAGYRWIFKLNPCWYVVNGYRDTLIYQKWFWQSPVETIIFWCITCLVGVVGIMLFKKLRPHFADVL
ncbi:MAG: ABC transporter permease [Phascolarctobacterium sp.]|uniref:ABC transporter permease n=1 Tax=Phascolarctobacterium sp. TaxID=2049039 RepID=UPI0026DAC8EF|nr:ABC transporter permease [Phascolarctobacterium sp.]MDO4922070.1 ABC transporter permease [Phascolarctobacterium sp.]